MRADMRTGAIVTSAAPDADPLVENAAGVATVLGACILLQISRAAAQEMLRGMAPVGTASPSRPAAGSADALLLMSAAGVPFFIGPTL